MFATNDNMAMGLMFAAHRHHLSIGEDLSPVGYNDTPLGRPAPDPLTSARLRSRPEPAQS